MNRAEFLSHFAWRAQEDLSYLPPAEGTLEKILSAAIDRIDFDAYQPQFDAFFALIIDASSHGLWGGEWKKNELITGLANLPPEERAKHIVAAMQVLSWLYDIQAWTNDRLPRCQIARIAAVWMVQLVGKFKGYPPEQLIALAKTTSGSFSGDASEFAGRMKVLLILASHAKELPQTPDARAALTQFLENVRPIGGPNQAEQKAIEKLAPIASGEQPEPKAAAKKHSAPKPAKSKVIRESERFWELPAESELRAAIAPDPPQPKKQATVRLTHANPYGPFDEAKLFVRIGDLENPTDESDGNSVNDWTACELVEELVHVDGREIPRSEAKEPFTDEVPWTATYEAKLKLPADECSIEIKMVSEHPEVPYHIVLADWDVSGE